MKSKNKKNIKKKAKNSGVISEEVEKAVGDCARASAMAVTELIRHYNLPLTAHFVYLNALADSIIKVSKEDEKDNTSSADKPSKA